jgi:hypothetical protein
MSKAEDVFDNAKEVIATPQEKTVVDHINQIYKNQSIFENRIKELTERIAILEKAAEKPKIPEPPIYKVKSIYYTKDYEFRGGVWNRHVVVVEGHPNTYFYDKPNNKDLILTPNTLFSARIEDDKFKGVQVLQEII